MPDEIKEKLKEIAPHLLEEKDLPMYLELCKISESLEKLSEMKMPEMKMEMPEKHLVEIAGAELVSIKGEKGDSPTDEHLTELLKPLIPEPIVGPQGKKGDKGDSIIGPQGPAGKDGESIVGPAGKDGKDGSPDKPEEVKKKLLDIGLTIEDIEDLKKTLDDMKKGIERRPIFGGGGFSKMALDSHILDPYTPTGAVNGVNTDFVLSHTPSPSTSLIVWKDGQKQKLTTDYTLSGVTITFLSAPLTDTIIECSHRI